MGFAILHLGYQCGIETKMAGARPGFQVDTLFYGAYFCVNRKLFYMKLIFDLGVLIVAGFMGLLMFIQKSRDLFRLWVAYDSAKLSGDKEKALELGRAFYIRKKGKLTSHDEEIIAGDLSNIKNQVSSIIAT
jgi:hypothetical protein